LKALEVDPVGEFRKKAAEAAAKAAAEEAKNDPNERAKQAARQKAAPAKMPKAGAAPPDTTEIARIRVPSDSLELKTDKMALPMMARKDSLLLSTAAMVPPTIP
jgi:hypothetical protein